MSSIARPFVGGSNSADHTSEDVIKSVDGVRLDPHMSRNFDQEQVLHVRDEVLPDAARRGDVKVVSACEELLTAHGYAVPNAVSGAWQPMDVPRSEMNVREMFGARMPEFGYWIIRSGDQFPDWLLVDKSGEYVYAEVEHRSSSFRNHGHDPKLCDLIVCWEHDEPEPQLPVLELFSGETFDAVVKVEVADRSRLDIHWNGVPVSKTRPLRQKTRGNYDGKGKTGAVDAVVEEFRRLRAAGETHGNAVAKTAEQSSVTRNTVRKYLRSEGVERTSGGVIDPNSKQRVVYERYMEVVSETPTANEAAELVASEFDVLPRTVLSYVSRVRARFGS